MQKLLNSSAVCERFAELAEKRLLSDECVSGFYDAHADEVSLGELLYRLDAKGVDRAEVDAQRSLHQRKREDVFGFVVCRQGETTVVLGASTWSDREQRTVNIDGSCWHLAAPLWRDDAWDDCKPTVFSAAPRLRPSALAAGLGRLTRLAA